VTTALAHVVLGLALAAPAPGGATPARLRDAAIDQSLQPGAAQPPPDTATVTGCVTDAATGSPLAGALVRALSANLESTTDHTGTYRLALVPGRHTLEVWVIGYARAERTISLTAGASWTLDFALIEAPPGITERITVSGTPATTPEPLVPSAHAIGAADLSRLRGVLADDALRAVQAMPGVAGGDDFTAELTIRGSAPEAVGVLLDGVDAPVLVSAIRGRDDSASIALVNTEVLAGASLRAGAYPQRVGGRTGAQVEFATREGARDRLRVRGAASLATAMVSAEGPIGSARRGSWLASVRSSYVGWLARQVDPELDTAIGFGDVFLKAVYDLGRASRVEVLGLGGRLVVDEQAELRGLNSLDQARDDSALVMTAVHTTLSDTARVSQRAYAMGNRFRNLSPQGRELGTGRDGWLGYSADGTATLWPMTVLRGGFELARQSSRQDLWRYVTRPGGVVAVPTERVDVEHGRAGAFLDLQWSAAAFALGGGARADWWASTASAHASPWAQALWQPAGPWTLRTAAGVHRQPPTPAQLAGLRGSAGLAPARAMHVDVGVERRIGSLRATITGFLRDETHTPWLPDSEPRLVGGWVVPGSTTTHWDDSGRVRARGLEVLLERRAPDGVSGWVSYAWARTREEITGTDLAFWGDYDQRHTLNVHLTRRFSYRVNASLRYRFGSNFPVVGYYREGPEVDDLPTYLLTDTRNDARIPVYSRLDIRADRAFAWGSRRLTLFAEVVNTLARRNLGPAGPGDVEKLFPILPAVGAAVEF